MMHGHEKSRSAIVAVKPTNKAERGNGFGAGFSPYQSARLSRYNAAS
jgi:hypothetical protein